MYFLVGEVRTSPLLFSLLLGFDIRSYLCLFICEEFLELIVYSVYDCFIVKGS
uniref:Uncharacterized protein n=1 Tax=Picea glauca TaxID=3330 RepID=A0A117NIU3_PICGL|nr:hypothetical protein ABT39_MTgene366 [Picea glauca]